LFNAVYSQNKTICCIIADGRKLCIGLLSSGCDTRRPHCLQDDPSSAGLSHVNIGHINTTLSTLFTTF